MEMASQAATSTPETVSSQEDKAQGAHLPGFSSHAPPFFANPFMAPFLPQQSNNAAPGSVIAGSGVSSPTTSPPPTAVVGQQSPFPGLDGTEFRMNPLTGGYFLAPSQYQEMMQQYMQSLMVAAATQQRSFNPAAPGMPFDVNGLPTTQPGDPNAALSAFTGLSLCQSAQPVPSTTSQSSTPSKLSSTSSAGAAPSPSPPVAVVQSVHLTELEHAFCATEPSAGSSALHNLDPAQGSTMTSDGAPATSRQPDIVNAEDKSRSNNDEPGTASDELKANEDSHNPEGDQDTADEVHENATSNAPTHTSLTAAGAVPDEEKASGASTSSDLDSSAKKASSEEPSSNATTQKSTIQEQRTAELIKKQMSEIEKEINRRIQNKNIKKIDETELAQLLNDHGFGSFVDAAANPELAANFSVSAADQAGLPYRAPGEPFTSPSTENPSLNQLRSSFSPPEPPTAIPLLNGYSTAGGQGIALNGGTSPLMPQGFTTMPSYPYGHQPTTASPTVPINSAPVGYAAPGQLPGNFYAAPQMPQQQNVLPPVSAITPEVAAALLQQLQQQNPSLLQSLVGGQLPNNQQASTNGSSHQEPALKAASTIPAPPPPANNVSRRPPGGSSARHHVTANRTASSTSTSSWALGNDDSGWNDLTKRHGSMSSASSNEPSGSHHANGVSDDKENHQQEPVWQMRDSYLKRLQRDEMRNRELHEQENGSLAGERLLNGGDDDVEETDKLLKRDHNESVEDAIKSKKSGNKKEVMVHEPAVLIEGVLFRARYLGSTQLTCDGRATKTSRMGQAQEAVARVKAPEGEIQPSTEIDLFISTEKIMVLNTDLQRISETDVRQDILMDHALRSISYIADIGDLVVLMARRVPQAGGDDDESDSIRKTPKVVCHVFESDEAAFIAQSIGQAFQVAYVEFLRANGIDDPAYLREIDYQEVLNAQELLGEELELFARKETQKDIVIRKKVGEALGVVVVESGWGSMLPTVVVANMAPGGAASRSNELNIGDQIIGINGISLVGLPLAAAQQNIKNAKSSTAVRLTVVHTPPVVEVRIKRPDTKYQLGFSVQNGVICSLLRGGIAERGGIRVGHRIIEINHQSVVAVPHEKIVNMLATATGEIHMKTMPTSMFRLLTGQEIPNYI